MPLYEKKIKELAVGTKFRFDDYPEGAYGLRTKAGVELFGPPPGSFDEGMFVPEPLIGAIFDDPYDQFSNSELIIL